MQKKKAIVIEDQPIIWDYIGSCLEDHYDVLEYCSTTAEAERAFREHQPDLVWMDCYLGELSESSQGIKNSGLQLATFVKNHNPEVKVFLFTASNESYILQTARQLRVEGIALGGKFVKDKAVIKQGVEAVANGLTWISPNLIDNIEMKEFSKITIFEFCVLTSMILGKTTSQIAEELDTTRKQVNNAIYRSKEKFGLPHSTSREDFLEMVRDKLKESFDAGQYYNVSDIVSINTVIENCLKPVYEQIKAGELDKVRLTTLCR